MEYGLWNFHGGFWTGGNSGFPPVEGISRNFYTTVNNEIEPPTFHVTTPGNGNSQNLFTAPSVSQQCPTTIRTNLEFLSMKHGTPGNGRAPPMVMPGHQDDIMQSVALESVPMASDMITEQNSMDSLAPTDSSMLPLLSHQQNHYSNHSSSNNSNTTRNSHHHNSNNNSSDPNSNSHITTPTNCNNNNINNNQEVKDGNNDNDENCNSSSEISKEDKNKLRRRDDEIWQDISGTNIKLENNTDIDYLFHQSYQHPMYGMVFSRMSSNKREATAISDETDEDELEEGGGPAMGAVDNGQDNNPPIQNGSPLLQSTSNATSISFSKNGYECGECGLVAETRPGLKKHISVFHPAPNADLRLNSILLRKMPTPSKCPMSSCSFRSTEKAEMEEHMTHHVPGVYKLNSKKRTGAITPQRVRYEREEYRCQICAYSCTVEKAFHKHLKIHSVGRQMNQIKISCVICGKDRSSEVDMNKHMKKHRDDRYFCCDICIFKTVQLKKLIQHRRMHTGEKPHLCPHCSYRSARRDNLRSHVRRVHKKDNLFCDTFSPRGLLITENLANPLAVPATPIPSGTLAGNQVPAINE